MWPTIDKIDEHADLAKEVKKLRDLLDSLKEEKEDRDLHKETHFEGYVSEIALVDDFVAHSGHRTINMLRYLIDCTTDLEYDGLGEPLWHSMHDIVLGGYGDEIHKGKDWED